MSSDVRFLCIKMFPTPKGLLCVFDTIDNCHMFQGPRSDCFKPTNHLQRLRNVTHVTYRMR